MEYDFYRFSHGDFEALVQALFQNLLGNGSIVYGLGPDGGRELTYQGKASFSSPLEIHDGLWIVQAKFRARNLHDHIQSVSCQTLQLLQAKTLYNLLFTYKQHKFEIALEKDASFYSFSAIADQGSSIAFTGDYKLKCDSLILLDGLRNPVIIHQKLIGYPTLADTILLTKKR